MTVMQIVRLPLLYFSLSVPCEAAEQVRIAHNNLLPPFAEVKDGKTVGLVVDIFRTAAERAGYSVEFLPVPIEQMELALNDGRARAALPMAITPERPRKAEFQCDAADVGRRSLCARARSDTGGPARVGRQDRRDAANRSTCRLHPEDGP